MEHQDMEPSMISIVHNTEEEDMEQIWMGMDNNLME
jgi:hypothetical protein